jgi:hypothetical protein
MNWRAAGVLVLLVILCGTSCYVLPAAIRRAFFGPPAAAPGAQLRDGVELLAGLKSYSSPDEAKRVLASRNWRVISDQPWPRTESRPRFSQLSVDADVMFCGDVGTLRLAFINELLVSTSFTPRSIDDCLKKLPNGEAFTEQGTNDADRHFWRNIGLDGEPFIGARDSRLQAEVSAWIRQYS